MSKLHLFFSGALLFTLACTTELSKVKIPISPPPLQPFDLYGTLNEEDSEDSPRTFLG
jgi:hypothetical protein